MRANSYRLSIETTDDIALAGLTKVTKLNPATVLRNERWLSEVIFHTFCKRLLEY
jgi:hypothetical protein